MNFITKLIKELKEKSNISKIKEAKEREDKLIEMIENDLRSIDPMIPETVQKMTDIIMDGQGFMIMATKLSKDGSKLDHQSIVSKGFKLGDILSSCEEYKRLGEDIIKKEEKKLTESTKEDNEIKD